MKLLHRFAWVGVMTIAFVFAVGASGCGGSETGPHPGTGIVKGVDTGARKITLDHDDIPGFMKGMTMTFQLAPEVDLAGIAPGEEVDFRVEEKGGVYTVTEVRPAK